MRTISMVRTRSRPRRHRVDEERPGSAACTATELDGTTSRTLAFVRSHGVAAFVVAMTAVAVAASITVVTTVLVATDRFDSGASTRWALVLATVVPVLVIPPLLNTSVGLIDRLDTSMRRVMDDARTDPLTGVLNRRGFFAELDRFDPDTDIEVGMVDLDDFKTLNDHHGHAAGDRALQVVAAWLVDAVGRSGAVGRLGGDEFAFANPVRSDGAGPVTQRFDVDGASFSVSIGRACGNRCEVDDVLRRADDRLYESKSRRVGSASSPVISPPVISPPVITPPVISPPGSSVPQPEP